MEQEKNKTRVLLTDEVLTKYTLLRRKEYYEDNLAFKGIAVCWENRKGNFSISLNLLGSWDVFYGLEFNPTRIKRNVLYLDELSMLYNLLTGEDLSIIE